MRWILLMAAMLTALPAARAQLLGSSVPAPSAVGTWEYRSADGINVVIVIGDDRSVQFTVTRNGQPSTIRGTLQNNTLALTTSDGKPEQFAFLLRDRNLVITGSKPDGSDEMIFTRKGGAATAAAPGTSPMPGTPPPSTGTPAAPKSDAKVVFEPAKIPGCKPEWDYATLEEKFDVVKAVWKDDGNKRILTIHLIAKDDYSFLGSTGTMGAFYDKDGVELKWEYINFDPRTVTKGQKLIGTVDISFMKRTDIPKIAKVFIGYKDR